MKKAQCLQAGDRIHILKKAPGQYCLPMSGKKFFLKKKKTIEKEKFFHGKILLETNLRKIAEYISKTLVGLQKKVILHLQEPLEGSV